MLGGYIDCDNHKDGGGSGSGDGGDGACSRWMMWAAVSPLFSSEIPVLYFISDLNHFLLD